MVSLVSSAWLQGGWGEDGPLFQGKCREEVISSQWYDVINSYKHIVMIG
jgi:hypothetical protein